MSKINYQSKSYITWSNMVKRCTSDKYHAYHNYGGCGIKVCDEWLDYGIFKSWYDLNYIDGYCLDKDLLTNDCKIYNPDTCLFISQTLNKFLTLRGRKRGEHPIGVNYKKTHERYVSQIMLDGKKKHLGLFNDPTLAHKAWQEAKRNQAIALQSKQTCSRTKAGLQRVIDKLTQHIEQGVETKSL